jgi:hypothetical protein
LVSRAGGCGVDGGGCAEQRQEDVEETHCGWLWLVNCSLRMCT